MKPHHQRKIIIVAPNKYELYLSCLVVWFGIISKSAPLYGPDAIIATGALLIGIVCEINALLDMQRMNWLEIILALGWLIVLLWLAGYFVELYIGALTAYKVPFSLPWIGRENR